MNVTKETIKNKMQTFHYIFTMIQKATSDFNAFQLAFPVCHVVF